MTGRGGTAEDDYTMRKSCFFVVFGFCFVVARHRRSFICPSFCLFPTSKVLNAHKKRTRLRPRKRLLQALYHPHAGVQ